MANADAARIPHSPPAACPVLEFAIDPAELPRLLRCAALLSRRHGRPRTAKHNIVWHDTADGALQARGLALAEQSGLWRLERLVPGSLADWLPAAPAPVLAQAESAAALGCASAHPLVALAAFNFTQRDFPLSAGGAGARLSVLDGELRGVAHTEAACRVVLAGAAPEMGAFAHELAQQTLLRVPPAGLAACAMARARGAPPPPRHIGAPHVPAGLSVDQALVLVTAHLADVILYWATLVPSRASSEPVHQMRVGLRRLRTALSIFARAAPGLAVASLSTELRGLARLLGAARDWDVFLEGTGAAVQAAFAQDRRIAAMVTAGAKRQTLAYQALADYLASDAWRRLGLALALLPSMRPWADLPADASPGDLRAPEVLAAPADAYAAQTLHRIFKHLLAAGENLSALPAESLHDLRKRAKKLRYTTEFFAPLFGAKAVRQFTGRLVDVQEALGAVNDAAVTADLMAQLGGGADRAFASGVVQGFVAASLAPATDAAAKAWRKLEKQDKFWH